MNVALARVLYAHALVAAPRLALGRFGSLARVLGDPRLGIVGVFLSLRLSFPTRIRSSATSSGTSPTSSVLVGCSTTRSSLPGCSCSTSGPRRSSSRLGCSGLFAKVVRSTRGRMRRHVWRPSGCRSQADSSNASRSRAEAPGAEGSNSSCWGSRRCWTSTGDLLNNGGAETGERHFGSHRLWAAGSRSSSPGARRGLGLQRRRLFDEAFCTRAAHAVACRRARCCSVGDGRRGGRRGAPAREPLVHAKLRGAVHEHRCRPRLGQELLRRTNGNDGGDRNMERSPEPRQQLRGRGTLGRQGGGNWLAAKAKP